jgi:hypothetical protein
MAARLMSRAERGKQETVSLGSVSTAGAGSCMLEGSGYSGTARSLVGRLDRSGLQETGYLP